MSSQLRTDQKQGSGESKANTLQNSKAKTVNPKDRKRDPLVVPEIPGFMKKLLNDKDRQIKDLQGITVTFFPNNIQEVVYLVSKQDEPNVVEQLTPSQFLKLQETVTQQRRLKHEQEAINGLQAKFFKRAFVKLPDDVNVERGREILGIHQPPVLKKVMNLSQREFGERFKTIKDVAVFWDQIPDNAVKAMVDYQNSILPGIDWVSTHTAAMAEVKRKEAEAAIKELEKAQRKQHSAEEGNSKKSTTVVQNPDGGSDLVNPLFADLLGVDAVTTAQPRNKMKLAWADMLDGAPSEYEELTILQGRVISRVRKLPSDKIAIVKKDVDKVLATAKPHILKVFLQYLAELEKGGTTTFAEYANQIHDGELTKLL